MLNRIPMENKILLELEKATATSPIEPEPLFSEEPAKKLIVLHWNKLRQLLGFCTGYYRLSGCHHHKLVYCSKDVWRFCDQIAETSEHILVDCPGIARKRSQLIGQINPAIEHFTTINPEALLSMLDLTGLKEVLWY